MKKSLLLPRELVREAEEKKLDSNRVYSFEIRKPGQTLYYFGANHSGDPKNPQYKKLLSYWRRFLKETKSKNCMVFVEGNLRPVRKDLEDAIRKGSEGAFITYYAAKKNIERFCPEEPPATRSRKLVKKFGRNKTLIKFFLMCLDSWNRQNPKPDYKKYVKDFWEVQKEVGIWPYKVPPLKKLEKTIEKTFKRKFKNTDWQFFNRLLNPNLKMDFTNEMALWQSDSRDLRIASAIERFWNKGKNLFVVMGSSHAFIEEPALRKCLK